MRGVYFSIAIFMAIQENRMYLCMVVITDRSLKNVEYFHLCFLKSVNFSNSLPVDLEFKSQKNQQQEWVYIKN